MVPIKHVALLAALILVTSLPSRGRPDPPAPDITDLPSESLFEQSSAVALNRDFPDRDISFLLLDAHTGRLLASRWENYDTPVPMGSLVKPFAALAYGDQHGLQYPTHTCRGTATGCWRPGGHGNVDLTKAIAYSCNSYFRLLTEGLSADDVSATAARFGLEAPAREATGAALAGLGSQWRISPLRMARAYVELVGLRQEPPVMLIVNGMAESARHGTGSEVDRALRRHKALVKTGTAICTHSPRAPGDGFTVALVPADDPKILLMVRIHGIPGARAAKTAGQMLQRIEE
jgi:cell division protein FtsI/penicillin-binding protein 2